MTPPLTDTVRADGSAAGDTPVSLRRGANQRASGDSPSPPRSLASRLWGLLVAPSPQLTSSVDRRKVRVVAISSFVTQVFFVFGALAAIRYQPSRVSVHVVVLGGGAVVTAVAYGLSRTRRLTPAIALLVAMYVIVPVLLLLLKADPDHPQPFTHSAWFMVAILFAGTLAPPWVTLLVGGVTLLVPPLVAVLGLATGMESVVHAMMFLASTTLLTYLLSRHRDAIHEEQSAELQARNADLSALGRSLEERVEARTADLKKSRDELDVAYTELRQNQETLLLSQKMASLGRLTAGIAHEMGSPLAAVRSAVSEAQSLVAEYGASVDDPGVGPADHRAIAAEMTASLDLAGKAAERAAAFLRGIKSQTRDDGTHKAVLFEPEAVLRDAVHMLGHEILACRSRVLVDVGASCGHLSGSPGKLGQVVTNLLTNALHANAESGGGDIDLRLRRSGGDVVLTVSDQGPGIPAEHFPRIFDPLFTTKPVNKGTGLGLTIVHDIVCGDFRGRIEAENLPGRGARFTVMLPVS